MVTAAAAPHANDNAIRTANIFNVITLRNSQCCLCSAQIRAILA
jgi:hypothetical protein